MEEPTPFELKAHADVDGSYTFTFSSEDASKTETRTADGIIRGAYSYIDSDGVLQKVQYLADENGFQAYGTNLPVGSTVPVKETPEVLEATADHFARVDEHQKKIAIAAELHAKFLAEHPELFPEETGRRAVHVVHHAAPAPVRAGRTFESHIELPRPDAHHVNHHATHHSAHASFLEDDEVKAARALHLEEVERVKAEHFAALANAPRSE